MGQSLIASYVIRVLREDDDPNRVRVVVRNVQTGEERQFSRLQEAFSYMESESRG